MQLLISELIESLNILYLMAFVLLTLSEGSLQWPLRQLISCIQTIIQTLIRRSGFTWAGLQVQ